MKFVALLVPLTAAVLMPFPAAAALPPAVQAMIDAALAKGNDAEINAILKFARETNPTDREEIDRIASGHRQQIEAARLARLSDPRLLGNWKGEGELGAFQSTGNTDSAGFSASLRLEREGLRWRHRLNGSIDVQETDGVRIKERLVAGYEPNFKLDGSLYLAGLAQFERDRFLGYLSRYTGAFSAGYRAFDRGGTTLDLEAGPAVRYTNFIDEDADTSLGGRAQIRYNWQITSSVKFIELASATLEGRSSSLASTTSLDTRLIGPLSARLSYDVRYESDPPDGRRNVDTLSRATLVYSF